MKCHNQKGKKERKRKKEKSNERLVARDRANATRPGISDRVRCEDIDTRLKKNGGSRMGERCKPVRGLMAQQTDAIMVRGVGSKHRQGHTFEKH
jgi:hypothetical protein